MTDNLDQILEKAADAVVTLFADTHVRPTTVHLIWLLLLDLPLTPTVSDDFGVETERHYQALQAVVNTSMPVSLIQLGQELDQALGNGPALTALVQQYAPTFKDTHFETVWDALRA